MKQCSDLFKAIFDSHGAGAKQECACGKVHFNTDDPGAFEEGELENLLKLAEKNPVRFVAVDHAVGTLRVGDVEIAWDCDCDTAQRYENFILKNAKTIREYLHLYAQKLREKAEEIDPMP